jgi:hypothetical protein
MKLLKKAGFPLLLLSIAGFNIAPRFQGEAVFNLSLVVMVLGGILLVASPFLRGGDDGAQEPAAAPPAPPASRAGALSSGSASYEPLPRPSGVEVSDFVPPWAVLAGGLASAAGALAFFAGPNGVSPYTVISFSLMPGGVMFILGAYFFYGSPATRRNIVRGGLALLSFLLIVGAIFLGVFIAAEAFAPENSAKLGLLAVVLLVFGMVGAYLGVRYQQSAEGRTIGRELGFVDASGGGPDGIYDSKGVMNGLEVLFNVEQGSPGKRSPAVFRLEVLCRCPNVSGVRLSARPEGLIVIALGSLPRVPDVPRWDFYDVRCEPAEAALRLLPEARRGVNVFSDEAGFESMSLEGSEFKFVFSLQGYIGTAYTRRVLQETSLLASRFV